MTATNSVQAVSRDQVQAVSRDQVQAVSCDQVQAVSRDQDGDVQDNIDPAARPTRRTFSTEEKLALLAAYEACDSGKKGEFARREGIYSSQLTEWRRARDADTLVARDSGASRRDRREFDKFEQRNKRLEAELERTRLALDIVGLWRNPDYVETVTRALCLTQIEQKFSA